MIGYSATSQTLTYKKVDSITYFQFTNLQYDSLAITGQQALSQEIDFYYLRMRMGISYYNNKKYEQALPHFIRAYGMNPADSTLQEYLYYTYLFSGKEVEAILFAKNVSSSMKQKIGFKKNYIEYIAIGGGGSSNNNIANAEKKDITGTENIYGAGMFQGRIAFGNFCLQHTLYSRLKLVYGVSVFNIKSLGIVQTADTTVKTNFSNTHTQYNFGASYQLKKGWNVSLGIGYFQQSISSFYGIYDTVLGNYQFKSENTIQRSMAGSLGVSKQMKCIKPSIHFSYSNFNNTKQYQGEAALVYYPFGNVNFYSISSVALINDDMENRLIYAQKFGGKILKWLWAEAKVSYGNHTNYSTQSGFLTYNTANPVKLIFGADLKFYWKQLEISPGYRYLQCEGNYLYYDTFTTFKTVNYNYSNHLLTTSLKWNF